MRKRSTPLASPPNWLPTLAAVCAVCAGVALRWSPYWGYGLTALTISGVFYYFRQTPQRLTALGGALLLTAMGYLSSAPPPPVTLRTSTNVYAPIEMNRSARFRGVVVDDPRLVRSGRRMTVELTSTTQASPGGEWRPAQGRVALTIGEGGRASAPAQVPAQAPAPARGDEVVFRAPLRRADGFRNPGTLWHSLFLARKSISARAFAKWPGKVAIEPSPLTKNRLDTFRQQVAEAISRAAPRMTAAVLRAIALGDRSTVTPKLFEDFRQTGTAHLLAVSGLHLGIVALGAAALLRVLFARIRRLSLSHPVQPLARLAALAPITLYAALAGFQTSTVRALMMTALIVSGLSLFKRTSVPGLLAATVLAVLIIDPLYATDPGLHLSIAALGGLFWLAPALKLPTSREDRLRRLSGANDLWFRVWTPTAKWLGGIFRASVAATLATSMIAAFHFGQLGLAGILYNPLAVPLIAFAALPLALLGVLVFPFFPTLSAHIWSWAGYPVELLLGAQRWIDLAAFSSSYNPFCNLWALGGGFMLLACPVLLRRGSKRWRLCALIGVALLTLPPLLTRTSHLIESDAQGWVLDVGLGQAVALRLPGPFWVLVDGGGLPGSTFDVGRAVVWPALAALGCDKLDLVISSHPHADHLGGLNSVVELGLVKELWLPATFRGDYRYKAALTSAKSWGTKVRWVAERSTTPAEIKSSGSTIRAALCEGATENDRGLVAEVTHGGVSLLIPGDIEGGGQRNLLRRDSNGLSAQLLVAPHHGAIDAVDFDFLGAVSPLAVLASCADAEELPSNELRRYCRESGVELFNTARDGSLKVEFGGGQWRVNPARR
jgi:competence protein ComEC